MVAKHAKLTKSKLRHAAITIASVISSDGRSHEETDGDGSESSSETEGLIEAQECSRGGSERNWFPYGAGQKTRRTKEINLRRTADESILEFTVTIILWFYLNSRYQYLIYVYEKVYTFRRTSNKILYSKTLCRWT